MTRPHSHDPPWLTERQRKRIAEWLRAESQRGGGRFAIPLSLLADLRAIGVDLGYPASGIPGLLTPSEALRYAEQLDKLSAEAA